jgi:hypothetical protein
VVLIVKVCFDGAQTAIEEKQFETAVEHIQSFYKDFLCMQEEVEDVYVELIECVENKLKLVIKKNLDDATTHSRLNDIER